MIGTAATPFEGTAALYAMRIATAAPRRAFVGLAARAASTWARTRWPYLGIAVACTPVALYSSSIAAPNGVEMMSALALWMSLIGLRSPPPEHIRRLAIIAGASGAMLATLRPLGPLWCLLVLGAVLSRPAPARARRPGCCAALSCGRGAGSCWSAPCRARHGCLATDALKLGVEEPVHTTLGHRLGAAATQLPAWILQAIAAFPLRNDASHPAVYACYLILFGAVVVLGLRAGTARARVAIGLVVATVLLFPYV